MAENIEQDAPEPSLADELASAYDSQVEAEATPPAEKAAPIERPAEAKAPASDGRVRGPDGKFTKASEGVQAGQIVRPAGEVAAPAQPQAAQQPAAAATPSPVEAPKSWAADAKELYSKADPKLQAYIAQRESQMSQGVQQIRTQLGAKAQLADQFREAVLPYEPIIRSEGGTPIGAVKDLLNTAYILRTGSPQAKAELVRGVCQQFGIDMGQLAVEQPQIDPHLQDIASRLQRTEAALQAQQRAASQQVLSGATGAIEAFAAEKDAQGNPLRPHFEAVRDDLISDVAAVRQANPSMPHAQVLQKAYERAVWANPDTRAKLIAAQNAAAQTAARETAARAGRAAVSVTGAPGVSASAARKSNQSVEADLSEAWDHAVSARI